jgi:hypothetical protein
MIPSYYIATTHLFAVLSTFTVFPSIHAAPASTYVNLNQGRAGSTFSVEQVTNPQWNSQMGPAALYQAYLKYSKYIATPPSFYTAEMNATNKTVTSASMIGNVAANPYPASADTQYLVTITVGVVSPQNLTVNLDTGSSDL